jgi:hypothetical protein
VGQATGSADDGGGGGGGINSMICTAGSNLIRMLIISNTAML